MIINYQEIREETKRKKDEAKKVATKTESKKAPAEEKKAPVKKMTKQYGSGNNDECYTHYYGVEPLLKYIPKNAVVWCPFDTEESEYVKLISKTNKVIFTHKNEEQDFLTYEPNEHWDIIISNPPFSIKEEVFKRAKSFNKPFALLMTINCLETKMPYRLFNDEDLQLLLFDKRIEYYRPNDIEKDTTGSINFGSAYFCLDFLPKQLIFEELNKPSAKELRALTALNNENYKNKIESEIA